MNQFDQAKAKYEKKRQAEASVVPTPEQPVEKKEQPKAKAVPVMKVTVDGPFPMTFELHYAGTLLSSQVTEKGLRDLFKKCLVPMGRVI